MSIFEKIREEKNKAPSNQSSSIFNRIRTSERERVQPKIDEAKATIPNLFEMNRNITNTIQTVETPSNPVTEQPQTEKKSLIDRIFQPGQDILLNPERNQWVEERVAQDKQQSTNPIAKAINTAVEPLSRAVYTATSFSPIAAFQQGAGQALGIKADTAPVKDNLASNIANMVGQAAGAFTSPAGAMGLGQSVLQAGSSAAKAAATKAPVLGNKVAQRAIEGGVAGALEGAYATGLQGGDAKELALNTALGAGLGSLGDVALVGISDGVKALRNKTQLSEVDSKISKVEMPTKNDQSTFENLFGNNPIGITPGTRGNQTLIDEHIVDTKTVQGPLKERAGMAIDSIEQNFIDQFAPFKEISKETYEKAMDTTRANNLATRSINNKMVDLEGNVVGNSLKDVYSSVPRGQKSLADRYAILRDSVNRMERNIQVWGEQEWFPKTSQEAAEMVAKLEERNPWLKQFGTEWDNFNRNRQDMWVKYGIVSEDLVKRLRETNPHYAPMKRQQTETSRLRSRVGRAGKSMSNQGANKLIQRAKGGKGKIIDPAQDMIESTATSYNAMLRNRVMQDIYQNVLENPDSYKDVIEIIPSSTKVKKEMMDEINDRLQSDDLDGLTDFVNEQFELAKAASKVNGKGQAKVVALINGEPVEMIVKDPSILKAIDGVSPAQINGVMKVLDTISRGIKQSATGVLAPLQGAKLAIRDLPIAITQSKDKVNFLTKDLPLAFAQQLAHWVPGLPENWTSVVNRYYNAGGGYEAFLRGDSKIRATSKNLVKQPILSPVNVRKTVIRTMLSPFTASKALGDAFENIPRIAAFNNAMRRNGWKTDEDSIRRALDEAREITVNWSRKGAKGQDIEALLPYSNAAVQGSYRFFKRFKEQPISAIGLIGAITAAKIASYEKFKDDPDYQNRSTFEKGIPIGKTADGKFRTIPVEPTESFVADQLFDLYKFAKRDEQNLKTTGKERVQSAAESFLPSYLSGPVNAFTQEGRAVDIPSAINTTVGGSALEPFMAVSSGKNFFGGDIVPRDHQSLPTDLQYNETTSAPGKWAAENLGMSAFMFDYLAQKLGGDFAKIGLPMTSDVGKGDPVGNIVSEVATRLKTLEDPVMKNRISQDYYKLYDKVSEAKSRSEKTGELLPTWYEDAYNAVTAQKNGTVAKDISELNKVKKEIQTDVSLTAKQRAEKLREIQTQTNLLRLEGIEILNKLGVNES